MGNTNEAAAKRIVVEYDDGSVKALEKGLVFHIEENEDTPEVAHITAEMVSMTGRDLYTVVSAAVELGVKLGMFGGDDDEES